MESGSLRPQGATPTTGDAADEGDAAEDTLDLPSPDLRPPAAAMAAAESAESSWSEPEVEQEQEVHSQDGTRPAARPVDVRSVQQASY